VIRQTILCAVLVAGVARAQHVLENEKARIAFDNRAVVTELIDRQSAPRQNLISHRLPGFWKLIFHRGRAFENVVRPEDQQYRIERDGARLLISVDKLRMGGETLDIAVRFTVRLEGDEVRWTARVENRAPVTIVDFYFPQIGGIDSLGDARASDDLIWPSNAGTRIKHVKAGMRPRVDGLTSIEEPVNAVANQHLDLAYPGQASMAWYEFTNDRRGIYFGAYDSRFQAGLLRVSRLFDAGGALQFTFSKFLFLKQGETWTSGDYVVAPHPGTWHTGARKYRAWADSWFKPQPKPEWVSRTQGMFLVILRQQYGDRMWRYRDLPRLYEEARKSGIDTVGLFGWTEAGHDNQYPVYKPDPEMGGEAALKEGLATIRKAGGNSILYIQGHLMDPTTDFYKSGGGERLAAKTIWGSPYYEQYNKSFESGFLRHFSRKLFAPVCPGDTAWDKVMQAGGRQLLDYGPTGLIYDQVGGIAAYPCFGNARGERESEAYSAGRQRLLTAIRSDLKQYRPDFGFMAEHFVDIYSRHLDFLHGAGTGFQWGDSAFPQVSRFTFPEVIMTQRHAAPRPDRKQVNFALAYGFRFELEVRYRADVETILREEKPHLREYLRKVSDLRKRYPILLTGTFLDDRGVANRNPAVSATLFSDGARRALVVWNNSGKPQEVAVEVEGKRFQEAAGIDGKLSAAPRTLAPQEVAVLIYE
jgi:hypothetical protein